MNFEELNAMLPYAKGGKEKSLSIEPYPNIKLLFPGRHALDTVPVGGDFCVCVTDPVFNTVDHQFTHTDIFKDVEHKRNEQFNPAQAVMRDYLKVVQGEEPPQVPEAYTMTMKNVFNYGISVPTFLHAAQCLAVAEHRRYAQFEAKFGGRFLPFRFAAGIAEGLWDAATASGIQRKGRVGVEILEKQYGTPTLTKELMSI